MTTSETHQQMRQQLIAAYQAPGLWGETPPDWLLPDGLKRGSDPHLAFLTLTYTISGGREPLALWAAARQTFATDPTLFDPHLLAHAQPTLLLPQLKAHKLLRKKSEATVWQRIGQALVMRGGGSVSQLLQSHQYDAHALLDMLFRSKTTFPVLSGEQTAPRWLYGLATAGVQPLLHAGQLPTAVSPAVVRALEGLAINTARVSSAIFPALDALGRLGCQQRTDADLPCPAAAACPVATHCRYASLL